MNRRSLWFRIVMMFTFLLCITLQVHGMMEKTVFCNEGEERVDVKKIALTFDDGPHPVYTDMLLDGLQKRNAKASFFVLGEHVEAYPEVVRRICDDGHLIGNHTYSHMQLKSTNREEYKQELRQTSELIQNVTGKEVIYVRPPYGCWDKAFESELNMFPVLWNIDPLDWQSSDADAIARKVLRNAKENAIILMHDNYESTVRAALQIVDTLQQQGYLFVTVDELLFD